MPDMTDPEVQKSLPKRIVIDGQTVETRPVDEIRKTQADTAFAKIARKKKMPFKCFRVSFPGSVI
jgi:hypothetical protein